MELEEGLEGGEDESRTITSEGIVFLVWVSLSEEDFLLIGAELSLENADLLPIR